MPPVETLVISEINDRIRNTEEFLSRTIYSARPEHAFSFLFERDRLRADATVEHAWQLYASALRSAITGGADWKNLQLVAPAVPEPICWDDSNFGNFYFHSVIADRINDYGPTYRKTERLFSSKYRAFLLAISLPPINTDAEVKANDALKEWNNASMQLGEIIISINQGWIAFDRRQKSSMDPADWITIDQWKSLTGSDRIVASSRDLVNLKHSKYLYWFTEAYGGNQYIYDAIRKIEDPRFKISAKLPGTIPGEIGGEDQFFRYQISPDYPSWKSRVQTTSQPIKFTFSGSSKVYDYSKTTIGGGGLIGLGFLGVVIGGQRKTVSIDSTSSSFEVSFKADVQGFDIFPGQWYDTEIFQLYRNGPFKPGTPIYDHQQRGSLFGNNGFIHHRPARAIIAYKPTIKIKLSDGDYKKFFEETKGAGAFCVGPFLVGAGGYYDKKESIKWNTNAAELELSNGSDTPQLIAFDCTEL